jgi:hypothetical protein
VKKGRGVRLATNSCGWEAAWHGTAPREGKVGAHRGSIGGS